MVTYKDSAYVVLTSHYILNVIAMTHAQKLPCFYAHMNMFTYLLHTYSESLHQVTTLFSILLQGKQRKL